MLGCIFPLPFPFVFLVLLLGSVTKIELRAGCCGGGGDVADEVWGRPKDEWREHLDGVGGAERCCGRDEDEKDETGMTVFGYERASQMTRREST